MKMSWFNVLAGLFFILMGLGMLLRVFGINIHLTRVAFALFIIFLGVKMLFPKPFGRGSESGSGDANSAVFSDSSVEHKDASPAQYSVAFGSQKIDLTKVDLSKGDVKIGVNAAFGSAEVTLDPKTPVKIVGSSAFGSMQLPGGNSAVFGTHTYRSAAYKEGAPALLIEANVAFGGVEIKPL